MRFFPSLSSKEDTNTAIDAQIQKFTERGWGLWAVELLKTNEFIGFIGLSVPKVDLPFSPCVEIAWRLKRSAWGNGYATEAAKAIVKYAFETEKIHRLIATCQPENNASVRVCEKLAMRLEGTFRKCIHYKDDIWWDEQFYSLLDEDYFEE